jgi:hypothetical protein
VAGRRRLDGSFGPVVEDLGDREVSDVVDGIRDVEGPLRKSNVRRSSSRRSPFGSTVASMATSVKR